MSLSSAPSGRQAAWVACLLMLGASPIGNAAAEDALRFADAQVTLATDITVSAATAGILVELTATAGQSLQRGAAVAQLDARQAQSELKTALEALQGALLESDNDVDLRYAEMTLAVHEKEYEQSRSANHRFAGSISDTDLRRQHLVVEQSKLRIEQAKRDMEVRQAKVAELRAATDSANLLVEQHMIHSPVSGIVAQQLVDAGEWVNAGDPIVRIIDLAEFHIEFFVDQNEVGQLSVGSQVEFVPHASTERPYQGVLRFVASELHPVTGQARVWAEVGNHDGKLKPGMRGTLTVQAP